MEKNEKIMYLAVLIIILGVFYLAARHSDETLVPPIEKTTTKADKNMELMSKPCQNEEGIEVPCKG